MKPLRLLFPKSVKSPPDFEPEAVAIGERVRPFTMTSPERIYAVIQAVNHIVRAGIPGDLVECGVWRGGSSMAAALTLLGRGVTDRDLHLFDTFEGMPAPGPEDRTFSGENPRERWNRQRRSGQGSAWSSVPLEDVRRNVTGTGYPASRLHFIKGMVETTIPEKAPDKIALLRLDTDWYASTKHELDHLFPRLARGGVLIIDDYGHWEGARKAVDEYFTAHDVKMLLARVDYTARMGVTP
ncbi:MAG: TylF/MycF/NovP-related O-methyltransferase [Planctomycetota bacterium]